MLVSLIGACGSRRESRCLLRTYAFTLTLLLLSLLGIALYLLVVGPTKVTEWVEANWGTVQENLPPNLSISKAQFMSLIETNQVALLTLTGLLVLVLGLDLIMACILVASVAKNGRLYNADLEMEPLKSTKRSKQSKKGGSKRSTTRKR